MLTDVYSLLKGAQQLLELKGLREGLFIMRNSKKNKSWHVLTLCHQQKVYNYEIKTQVCLSGPKDIKLFFMLNLTEHKISL